jgi:hypothetical protein
VPSTGAAVRDHRIAVRLRRNPHPEIVVKDLQEMAGDRIPTLLCWEPPEPGPKPSAF